MTDFHIEERGKIKVDEIPQALAKDRSVTVEMFCIFVTASIRKLDLRLKVKNLVSLHGLIEESVKIGSF